MTLIVEQRLSDSSYVETVTQGQTVDDGDSIRPAEIHWHMIFVKYNGNSRFLIVGPWTTAGAVYWAEGAEILWVKFKLGSFMPHLPARNFLNVETALPNASSKSFWLQGSAWQFPDYHNIDTFVHRLVRQEVLLVDPIVNASLQDQPLSLSPRTLRHRFLHSTGLTQSHIRQVERAQRAAALLTQGSSILDTVHELGYFDQPHLTRSLKRFVGKTPFQLTQLSEPE